MYLLLSQICIRQCVFRNPVKSRWFSFAACQAIIITPSCPKRKSRNGSLRQVIVFGRREGIHGPMKRNNVRHVCFNEFADGSLRLRRWYVKKIHHIHDVWPDHAAVMEAEEFLRHSPVSWSPVVSIAERRIGSCAEVLVLWLRWMAPYWATFEIKRNGSLIRLLRIKSVAMRTQTTATNNESHVEKWITRAISSHFVLCLRRGRI